MSRMRIFGLPPERMGRLLSAGEQHGPQDDGPANSPVGSTISSTNAAEQPGHSIGRYKLLHVLGEGGMGVVYLAEQEHPIRRQVALKVIKPGMDSKRVLARFEAEQQALALMEHPHVARVYDTGLAPSGRPYFVMEHVKGLPITEHCDKCRLTIEQRLHLFLAVCEAVQHAHQKGIIHRDLKPSNILVSFEGDRVIPKVIDFGVARAISQPLTGRTLYTEQGQLIGTPEYMSPEQADLGNQDIDTRTDVYSLGIVLHELLTGILPFDPKTFRTGGIDHIRKVICEEDPKTPSTRLSRASAEECAESARRRRTDPWMLRHKLSGDLDWITLKAMEKDRTRRYPSVDAMATDIHNYLGHQPVSAAPPGAGYRARKFLRRHRQAAVLLGMTILVLVGASFGLLMSRRAAREYRLAQSLEHHRALSEAQTLVAARQHEEASAQLAQLLDSSHVGRQARLLHAQLLMDQREMVAAVAELESLLEGSDEIAGQAHFLLANIYYETDPWAPGRTREFATKWERHSRQAETLIAGTAQYCFLQAKAESVVSRKLDLLTRALELDKEHYESLRERAYIHYAQREYPSMGRDAARMIGLRSGNSAGYLFSALAFREQGHYLQAIADHDEAVHLAPDDPTVYEERRETYMRMGRYSLALADARRASELDPENLSRHVRIFLAFVALGQHDEARRYYEHVISEPWAQTEYSPWAWATGSWSTKDWFCFFTRAYTGDALSTGQTWPASVNQPECLALPTIYEAVRYHARLSRRGTRVVAKGTGPSWNPDGTKMAHTQGAFMASGIAVLDLETGTTELLTVPGKDPAWSPDGKYIAYVRDRRSLSMAALMEPADAMERHRKSGRPDYPSVEEIWLIELATRRAERIVASARWPAWSKDSRRLYYRSYRDNALCSISVDGLSASEKILDNCGDFPEMSPDARYIAHATFRRLDLVDVLSQKSVMNWIAPPFPHRGLFNHWSHDGREIAVGGWHGTSMGLWIFSTETGEARRMIDGLAVKARWSPDGSKMAIELGHPYWEVWLVDLDANQPTAETFGDGRTQREHCLELIESCNRSIVADPNYLEGHLCRTDAALWIEDPRAPQYLEELERVFRCTPYHAGGCIARAQATLSSSAELRDRLLPLSVLLARKAVEKESENVDFLTTLGEAFLRAGDQENAEVTLQEAYDLTIAGSGSPRPTTAKVVELLAHLCESRGEPEEAVKWRSKSPHEDAAAE